MKRAVLLLLVGWLSSACASASARTPADRPALEVPPPPPRSIEPTPKPEAPGPEPVSDLPSSSSPAPANRPRPNTREAPPRAEQQKPAEPAQPPVTEPPAATPPVAAPPVPPRRTPNSASGPEAAKQVRDAIDRAQKALQGVNFQKLNNSQQRQYNYAKMMLQQCEEQLKTSNFDIARENADKAHRIATELQGR
jgi:hypothetical protein